MSYNPLFDSAYYRRRYSDVGIAHVDPWRHYRLHGASEGRSPNQVFDSAWYRRTYPDVAASGLLPLDHYYFYGAREGRDPGPSFSTSYYLSTNPDVRRAGVNPLQHYLRSGIREGRRPRAGGGHSAAIAYGTTEPAPLIPAVIDRLRARVSAASFRRQARGRPVALVIAGSYPRPQRDAGSVFLLNVLRLLCDSGFETMFVPTNPRTADEADRDRLHRLGVRTLEPSRLSAIQALLRALGDQLDLVWLSRYDSGGSFIDDVRTLSPHAKVVFDPVDLHWLRQSREAAVANDRAGMFEAMTVREREIYLVRRADMSIVVSDAERELLVKTVPGASVEWLPMPHEVPGRTADFDSRAGVAFVGNYLHRPNVDAVIHFLDHVWPLVQRRLPALDLYIVGPELPSTITERNDARVHFIGYVDDLDGWLRRVRLTVAPLRFGAGAKGKVITSLASGVPCVATSIAAEGLGLPAEAIALADEPDSQAAAIVRLHEDHDAWQHMSDAALAWAESTISMDAARVRIDVILEKLGLPQTRDMRRAA